MTIKILKFLLLGLFLSWMACVKTWDYNPADIPNDFVPLPKPEADKGYQLHVPAFPIPPQFEREWFMRMAVGNTEEIYMTGYEVRQREGSHHVIAYQYDDETKPGLPKIGEMRDQNTPDGRLNLFSNMEDMRLLAEAASPYQKVEFPVGYAVPIAANSTLDLNSHYFNKSDKTIFGEVTMNIYTKPRSEVQFFLKQNEVDNVDVLVLPPKKTTKITYTEIMEEDRKLKIIFSHMHKRGKKFEVYYVGGAKDGQLFYDNDDWHDPKFVYLPDLLEIKKGEGIRTVVTYENETNREIRFGVTSEDEMGIFFYYYL
jgi:Copper type II ascorbate-dependent monooxygenase, C-terminal domain